MPQGDHKIGTLRLKQIKSNKRIVSGAVPPILYRINSLARTGRLDDGKNTQNTPVRTNGALAERWELYHQAKLARIGSNEHPDLC